MSSRWISTSLRRPATSPSRLMAACAALTSDDLPMPRAPHSSALLAGRARAKRWVFSTRRSRTRSMPAQERKVDPVDALNRRQRAAVGAPDERLGRLEIGLRRGRGRSALKRFGDAAEKVGLAFERRQGKSSSIDGPRCATVQQQAPAPRRRRSTGFAQQDFLRPRPTRPHAAATAIEWPRRRPAPHRPPLPAGRSGYSGGRLERLY